MAESYLSKRAAVRERLVRQELDERATKLCRVCETCDGRHHVDVEVFGDDGEFVGYECRHCERRFEPCPSCGGPHVNGVCHGECGDDE